MTFFEDLYPGMILELKGNSGFNDGDRFDIAIIISVEDDLCKMLRINFGLDPGNFYYRESLQNVEKEIWRDYSSYLWSRSKTLSKGFWYTFWRER